MRKKGGERPSEFLPTQALRAASLQRPWGLCLLLLKTQGSGPGGSGELGGRGGVDLFESSFRWSLVPLRADASHSASSFGTGMDVTTVTTEEGPKSEWGSR